MSLPDVGPLNDMQARSLVHGYYASTAFVDAQIGLVLDEMDRQDLWKSTIVVLWGDHGWHLGDHGLRCKHTNFEQSARIPVIIVAPGLSGNRKTRALMETVDIYPTLCELAGIQPAKDLPGISLLPILKDAKVSVKDEAFHVFPRGSWATGSDWLLGRAVRTARWRYVEWQSMKDGNVAARELYDYENDPEESINVAYKPEFAAIITDHATRIAKLGPAKSPVPRDPALAQPAPVTNEKGILQKASD